MDQKKRNSILRRAYSQEDENTTNDPNERQKRRISFRGKQFVRIFSKEQITQVWQNSYELSDCGETSNTSNAKQDNSTDLLQIHSSSALSTTKEYIDKSDASEVVIHNTLGVTLLDCEKYCIKTEDQMKPQIKTKSAQKIDYKITSNTNQSITAVGNERTEQATDSTSTNVNLACHDDSSNKENIVPERLTMVDAHPSKKDNLSIKMDFDSSGEISFENVNKPPQFEEKDFKNACTSQPKPKEITRQNAMEMSDVFQDVSGFYPLESTVSSFTTDDSMENFYGSIIPPELLPQMGKKIDLQKLNDNIAKGHLKLFPNVERTKKSSKSRIMKNEKRTCNSINNERSAEQTKHSISIQSSTSIDYSKGAIPKSYNSIKDQTIHIPTNVETSSYFDLPKDTSTQNRKTIYYNDGIKSEDQEIVQQKGVIASSMNDESDIHVVRKTTRNPSIIQNKTIDIGLSKPVNNCKANSDRRTIYFENESMAIEEPFEKTNDQVFEEVSNTNMDNNASKLSPKKSKFLFLHRTISNENMDLTTNLDMNEENKETLPNNKRYTHHFDKSGMVDITNVINETVEEHDCKNSEEVNTQKEDISLLDESDCVISETQAMDVSQTQQLNLQNNKDNEYQTHYFDEIEQMPIPNQSSLYPSKNKTETLLGNVEGHIYKNSEEQICEVNTQKEDISLLDESDCVVPETQAMDVSQTPQLNSQNHKQNVYKTRYFDENEEMHITNCSNEERSRKSVQRSLYPTKIRTETKLESSTLKSVNENRFENSNMVQKNFSLLNNVEPAEFNIAIEKSKTVEFQEHIESAGYKNLNLSWKIGHSIEKEINSFQPSMEVQYQSSFPAKNNQFSHIFNATERINIDGVEDDANRQPEKIEKVKTAFNRRFTHIFHDTDAQIPFIEEQRPPDTISVEKKSIRRTVHFATDMDLTSDENNEQESFNNAGDPEMQMKSIRNGDEVRNVRFEINLATPNKPKKENFSSDVSEMEIGMSPWLKTSISSFNRRSKAMTEPETPHRSIIEFELLENYANLTPKSGYVEKLFMNQKRAPSTLTPNYPVSKKRQPSTSAISFFENVNLHSESNTENVENLEQPPRGKARLELFFSRAKSNYFLNQMQQEKLSTPSNSKFIKSSIPVYTDSANKPKTSRISSPNIDCSLEACDETRFVANNDTENLYKPKTSRISSPNMKSILNIDCSLEACDVGICVANNDTENLNKPRTSRVSSPNMKRILNIDCSLETGDVGRFVANNDTQKLLVLDDINITAGLNISKEQHKDGKRSIFISDENPITISDVSEHYRSLKKELTHLADEPFVKQRRSIGKTEDLMVSLLEIIDNGDNIDQTKLTLVETLLDETDDDEELDELDKKNNTDGNMKTYFQSSLNKDDDEEHGKSSARDHDIENNSIIPEIETATGNFGKRQSDVVLCRKCNKCEGTVLNDETVVSESNESFVMPSLPSVDDLRKTFFDNMAKMRRGPTLEFALEFNRRMNLQSSLKTFNLSSFQFDSTAVEDLKEYEEDADIVEYKRKSAELNKSFQEMLSKASRIPFVSRLRLEVKKKLKGWKVNTKREVSQIISFLHRKLDTFSILLLYKRVDPFGQDVIINSISFEESIKYNKSLWKPFDLMIHFHLELFLPKNLHSFCTGNSEHDVCEMMFKINKICETVLTMCMDLWRIIFETGSRLIRINDQVVIRKIIRKPIYNSNGLYQRPDNTEFRIEVMNIRNLCFKDIAKPALHKFKEDIANLPIGLDFVKIFLNNPEQFLRESNDQSATS